MTPPFKPQVQSADDLKNLHLPSFHRHFTDEAVQLSPDKPYGFGIFEVLSSYLSFCMSKLTLFRLFCRSVIQEIDQSELEGFQYVKPLLMSQEDSVWRADIFGAFLYTWTVRTFPALPMVIADILLSFFKPTLGHLALVSVTGWRSVLLPGGYSLFSAFFYFLHFPPPAPFQLSLLLCECLLYPFLATFLPVWNQFLCVFFFTFYQPPLYTVSEQRFKNGSFFSDIIGQTFRFGRKGEGWLNFQLLTLCIQRPFVFFSIRYN